MLELRNEQWALRVALSSIGDLLDDRAEVDIDPADFRDRLAIVALQYRRHQTREAEVIRAALSIDLTEPGDHPPSPPE